MKLWRFGLFNLFLFLSVLNVVMNDLYFLSVVCSIFLVYGGTLAFIVNIVSVDVSDCCVCDFCGGEIMLLWCLSMFLNCLLRLFKSLFVVFEDFVVLFFTRRNIFRVFGIKSRESY